MTGDPSLDYLEGRLTGWSDACARPSPCVAASDEAPDDRFRGLYLGETDVDRLAARARREPGIADDETLAFVATSRRAPTRRRPRATGCACVTSQRAFDLVPADVELLLVALAPDLDARLESLYGYLHDDVSRRRASIGLALELAGVPLPGAAARARLQAGAPLVDSGLVEVEETERPFLTRGLRVPDRVTMYLLGDDRPDELLLPLLGESGPAAGGDPAALAGALRAGSRLALPARGARRLGHRPRGRGARRASAPAVVLDLRRLSPDADVAAIASCAGREARLRGAARRGPARRARRRGAPAVRSFAELGWPTVLYGTCSWNPAHSRGVPVLVDVGLASPEERAGWLAREPRRRRRRRRAWTQQPRRPSSASARWRSPARRSPRSSRPRCAAVP